MEPRNHANGMGEAILLCRLIDAPSASALAHILLDTPRHRTEYFTSQTHTRQTRGESVHCLVGVRSHQIPGRIAASRRSLVGEWASMSTKTVALQASSTGGPRPGPWGRQVGIEAGPPSFVFLASEHGQTANLDQMKNVNP
jgi:hypothetical protein